MGQHTRDLALGVRLGEKARVHEDEAAGQSEGVDRVVVHNLEGEGNLRVGVPNKVLTDAVHVLGDHRVADHLGGPYHLVSERLAEGDLFLDGVEVDLAVNVAFADGLNVVFLLLFLLLGFVVLGEQQPRKSKTQSEDEKPLASVHDRPSPWYGNSPQTAWVHHYCRRLIRPAVPGSVILFTSMTTRTGPSAGRARHAVPLHLPWGDSTSPRRAARGRRTGSASRERRGRSHRRSHARPCGNGWRRSACCRTR